MWSVRVGGLLSKFPFFSFSTAFRGWGYPFWLSRKLIERLLTFLDSMLALVLCCCFCLGCIPYCIDGTKDVNHKCSSCQSLLAVWHRSDSKAVVVAYK